MTTDQDAQVLQLATLLVKQFEGCRLTAYQDQAGVWTVGWGQTGPKVVKGTAWTQAQADQSLSDALQWLWRRLDSDLGRDLLPQQAAAILSLAYNVGLGALERSDMWRLLQDGQVGPASEHFTRFDKVRLAGSQLLTTDPGLLRRRKAELALFTSTLA